MEVHRCRFISHLPAAVVDICTAASLSAVLRSDSSIDLYQTNNWVLVLSFPGLETYGARRVLWIRNDMLVTCGTAGLLCLWQLSSLSPVSETAIPGGAIWGMALGAEETLALASDDGVVRLYTLAEDLSFGLLKTFHKQPCRMLDVIWPSADTILSSGSDGGIYKWTPRHNTCQLRMANQACVWRLQSLSEDLLASGDSQGSVNIWESQYGTLVTSLHTHEADILALTYFNECLYAAGVDSKVVQIKEASGTWRITGKCRGQSHDIYALAAATVLISGGVTTDLCLYPVDLFDSEGDAIILHREKVQYKAKPYRHIPALRLVNYGGAGVQGNGKIILCHHSSATVELWSIDNSTSEIIKFATVLSKAKEPVTASDVSPNGKFFAYSTVSYTRIFKIAGKEELRLESIMLSSGASVCKFGSRGLFMAYKSVKFVDIERLEEETLEVTIQAIATHMAVRGSTCALRLFDNTVKIYKDSVLKAVLPRLETTITALSLSYSKSLYLSTDSNLLLGFSLKTMELDSFSKQYSTKLPKNYLSEFHRVIGIHFFENRKNMALLHTHYSYTWVDLTRPPPRKSAILPKKNFSDSKLSWTGLLASHPLHTSKPGAEPMDVDSDIVENFAINKRLGPLLQLHALEDCICAVELPWEEAVSRLPQPLALHKYGS